MNHNFRISGAPRYISKAGLRSTAEGGPENPLPGIAEFMQGAEHLGVVGTGSYRWGTNFSYGNYGATDQSLVADGYVQVLGDGQTRFCKFVNASTQFTGLVFEQFAGFNFRAYEYANPVSYHRCTFRVLPAFAAAANSGGTGGVEFEDCVFVNVHLSAGAYAWSFTRCLFFNCTTDGPVAALTACYLDATSALRADRATNTNVDPGADPATGYGLSLAGADFARQVPGNLSLPSGFNNPALGDYSLHPDSPHVAAGIGPAQWRQGRSFTAQFTGAAGEAVSGTNTRFVPQDAGPAVAVAATTGVLDATSQGALVIRASASADGQARLRTGPVLHAEEAPFEISQLTALGGYNFDAAYPASEDRFQLNQPEVYNNNVFVLSEYEAGSAGRNPTRLSYGIRWSRLPVPPRSDHPEDWVTGDAFVECEWNTRPLYNLATLVGNGRPDFDPAQAEPIVCTWYELLLGLSNVYYH